VSDEFSTDESTTRDATNRPEDYRS